MSYSSVIEYLFALQKHGIKLGLETMRILLDRIGNPPSLASRAAYRRDQRQGFDGGDGRRRSFSIPAGASDCIRLPTSSNSESGFVSTGA